MFLIDRVFIEFTVLFHTKGINDAYAFQRGARNVILSPAYKYVDAFIVVHCKKPCPLENTVPSSVLLCNNLYFLVFNAHPMFYIKRAFIEYTTLIHTKRINEAYGSQG